jgi:hypothetical protein
VSTWKGYRIIDENGEKTEFFQQMVDRENNVALMLAAE